MSAPLEALRDLADGPGSRVEKAGEAARLLSAWGPYRWVGLYDVSTTEIAVIAWTGPEPPTYPRFPITKGLNGAAAASTPFSSATNGCWRNVLATCFGYG